MTRPTILLFSLLSLLWCPPLRAQTYDSAAGERVDFEQARRAHRKVLFGAPAHVGRLAIEQGVTLVMGSTWYWLSRELNSTDWDLEPTWEDFGKRFSTIRLIRFDTNRFYVNQGHLLAGAVHYTLPRANNFGIGGALVTGIITSALWEWVFEYREYISLNDLLTSPYGGQPIGEVMFKFGELYNRQGGSLSMPAKALTFLFGQPRAFHNWLGDDEPVMPDDAGLAMSHDFKASAGLTAFAPRAGGVDEFAGSFRLDTSIVDIPGYQRVGKFDTFFRDGNFVDFKLEFLLGDKPYWKRFTASARAELIGLYAQNIDEDGGWALEVGLGRGAWLESRQQAGLDDAIGMVDYLGPKAALDLFIGPTHLELSAGIYGDFGSVTSPAYAELADSFAPDTLRSELQEQGYYFAWGITAVPRARLFVERLEVGIGLDFSAFAALRGPDRRHYNDVPTPMRLRDQRLALRADLAYRLADRLDVQLVYQHLRRRSQLDDFELTHTVGETSVTLGYRF